MTSNQRKVGTLVLSAEGTEEAERLVSLVALGLCRAVAEGLLSPAYACDRFFGPALFRRVERLGGDVGLRHAIGLATELEDISALIPDKLPVSTAAIEAEFLAVLKRLGEPGVEEGKWLVPLGDKAG